MAKSVAVRPTYRIQTRRAVSRIRVFSVSISGPGISCSSSWRPPTRRRGRTASASTMIPIPPSHCVSWRQSRSPLGSASTSVRMLPPVVLKPDMPSK